MKYDYLIIGAGMGGLSAGLNLANHGKKTIILEKNALPGGSVTTFKKGRFEFDTSLYDLYDYGDDTYIGNINKILLEYKIDLETKIIPFNIRINEKISNSNYVIKGEIDDFILELERLKEGSIEPLKKFIKIIKEINDAVELIKDNNLKIEEYPHFNKYLESNTLDALKDLKMPLETINKLGIFWIELGSPLNKLSFIDFSLFMYKLIFKKDAILLNKSLDFTLKLVKRYQELGGKFYYNSEVIEVSKENDYYLIKTKDNLEYKAKHVIFDVSKRYAYKELIKEENKEVNKLENARTIGPNGVVVYLGLNRSYQDLGLKNYKYYRFNSLDSETNIRTMNKLDHPTFEAIIPNVVNELASPSNTTIVVLKRIYFEDVFNHITNYEKLKEDLALDLIHQFEDTFKIDIEEYIEQIEVLTPISFAHLTNTINGSMFGYMLKGYDNSINRLISEPDELIKDFSFVGSYSLFGPGVNNAFYSGYYLTNKLLNKER